MTDTKNVKVSEVVYDKIGAEKKSGETFDDALRRMIGIYPNLDDLMAYLPEEVREWGKEIVNVIDECGDFDREVERNHVKHGHTNFDSVLFKDKEKEMEIASVDVCEEHFYVRYRNKDGDMEVVVGRVYENTSEDMFKEIKEETRSKVSGAVRKWGTIDL